MAALVSSFAAAGKGIGSEVRSQLLSMPTTWQLLLFRIVLWLRETCMAQVAEVSEVVEAAFQVRQLQSRHHSFQSGSKPTVQSPAGRPMHRQAPLPLLLNRLNCSGRA